MSSATARPGRPASGSQVAPPGGRGIAALFADPAFRRIWMVGIFSGTIRWLETLAVAVFVFERTGDAFLVALMMFLRMVPMLLFGAVAGVVADRVSRKKLLIGGLGVLCTNSIVMGLLALSGTIEIWHLAVGIFVSGIVWSTEFPVRRTMMGEIAGMNRVGLAMGVDSATSNATRMLGPTLGGVLLQFLQLEGVYFVGTAFLATSIILAIPIRYSQAAASAAASSFLGNLGSGFSYIRSRRVIVGVLTVTILLNVLGFPFISMLPVIGRDELGLSPVLTGILASAEGLGAMIAALVIVSRAGLLQYTRIYLYGSLIFLVAVLLFSLSSWFGLSLALVFIGGMGLAGFATMQVTLIIMATPPEMRSRAMGVLSVSIGMGPLGILLVGVLAAGLGAPMAVLIMASAGLLSTALAAFIWPELRRGTDVRPPDLRQQFETAA